VPKLNCATCHQGAYKPLYGANILNGHPGLTGVKTAAVVASADPAASASAPGAAVVDPAAPAPAAAASAPR
jgi:photosynthetic reaction center cytochrome c subunit